jgi:hypothetical protein
MHFHSVALSPTMSGHDKPIICTEYSGPGLFEFQPNLQFASLFAPWQESLTSPDEAVRTAKAKEVEQAIAAMYAHRETLPEQTQMFLMDAPAALEAKLRRIQARDIVKRNVLALSAGLQKTLYWDLWHDTSKRDDLLTLLYGKIKLMDYDDAGTLDRYYPQADAFPLMNHELEGVDGVQQITVSDRPSIYLFEAHRAGRPSVFVVWDQRDTFSGEAQPPVSFEWAWSSPTASAIDALGAQHDAPVQAGRVSLMVSDTPIFVRP